MTAPFRVLGKWAHPMHNSEGYELLTDAEHEVRVELESVTVALSAWDPDDGEAWADELTAKRGALLR